MTNTFDGTNFKHLAYVYAAKYIIILLSPKSFLRCNGK